MRLADVLADCRCEMDKRASPDIEISGIAYDSRKAEEGSVFVAIRGGTSDGHDFIDDALRRGAAAVVYERAGSYSVDRSRQPAPAFLMVEDGREALACISNNFYGRPSEKVQVVGVTGTNGKTTTTYIIKSILEACSKSVGLIGTITYIVGDRMYPAAYTTPEAPEFQGLLAEMASKGCGYVVTEVSSHSLFQKRVDHTRFIVAVFTNLTRDHLDFHGTMEHYYVSKRRLFMELLSGEGTAIINADDEWGRRLEEEIRKEAEASKHARKVPSVITYGTGAGADVSASDISDSFSGVSFRLGYRDMSCRVDSPLVGMPNVYNLLAAASAAIALDVPVEAIREGIEKVSHIRGRMERIDAGQDFLCIVDYAHTPDALERLLNTAKELSRTEGVLAGLRGGAVISGPPRIITVFGCGGDRDRGKRPLMGEIATRLSDHTIITSDNPRRENPVTIMEEIVSGVSGSNYEMVPDRRMAIKAAVGKARTGDVVIIAGKGHEDYQETGGTRFRFSDREVAEEAIKNRFKGDGTDAV